VAAAGRFCVAGQKIVWQRFESEVVVINLESGTYYSLNETGARLWSMMEAGWTPDEAAERIQAGGAPADARDQVLAYWGRLVEEGLILPAANGVVRRGPAEDAACPWTPPAIAAYTDMQDLFLLDPVHDVDEAGWPSRPAEGR
jgi:hypothetical protein